MLPKLQRLFRAHLVIYGQKENFLVFFLQSLWTITNDMFFSGHTGTLVVAGIQFYTTNFMFVALLHFLFALPLVATLVVAFRVHRGIDVLADFCRDCGV